jgi:hypothetical protein
MYCRRGFSIIEAIAAVAIAGTVMVATLTMFKLQGQTLSSLKLTSSRDALFGEVRTYSTALATVMRANTDSFNAAFRACISGPAPCTANVETPMRLTDPFNNRIYSGTQTNPVRYNREGYPCPGGANATATACPFEVFSSFFATCTGGAPTCPTAASVRITFTIRHNPDDDRLGGRLKDQSGFSVFTAPQILNGTISCPTNQVLSGINADGTPVCVANGAGTPCMTSNGTIVPHGTFRTGQGYFLPNGGVTQFTCFCQSGSYVVFNGSGDCATLF